MIALVTATISPAQHTGSFYSAEERYQQTLKTLQKLSDYAFSSIYILDNSANTRLLEMLQTETGRQVTIFHNNQYSFRNKGLNEALLILNHIAKLPADQPIFKISGRYYPVDGFDPDILTDPVTEFAGLAQHIKSRNPLVSTRAYWVKNRHILETILLLAVEEMIAYSKGLHGPASALDILSTAITGNVGVKYQLSIESAFYRIVKKQVKARFVDRLNIEGYVAGSNSHELLSE